MACLQNTSNN